MAPRRLLSSRWWPITRPASSTLTSRGSAKSRRPPCRHHPSSSDFVKPPSMEALEARLRGRGTETEEKIKRRLDGAAAELAYADENAGANFDAVIVNDCVKAAYAELKKVIAGVIAAVTAAKAEGPKST
eukprot:m.194569 g.194569  ORF g.194569 m.194569 type:complete len:129 (+) comp15213_c0_seq3:311-697(+)